MSLPPKGTSQLRKGRVSITGTAYFITKATRKRLEADQPYHTGLLISPGVPEIIINSLEYLHNKAELNLIAYTIMPDHLHLLFTLGEKQILSKLLDRFFGFTGHEITRVLNWQEPFWQAGYYDRALRTEEEVETVYKYIIENPVKAGYVVEAKDWNWLYPNPP